MNILLLGGIAESKQLAQQLIDQRHSIIYSIAGLVRTPDLNCQIHSGGFSDANTPGNQGLADYCLAHNIQLLIDATHPYADIISANAVDAAKRIHIPCWRYSRAGWDQAQYPHWHHYQQWDDLAPQIEHYKRPFFSIGASVTKHIHQRPPHQQWIVRSARKLDTVEGMTQINAIGPFNYQQELALMQQHKIDALISKNSGCSRVAEKLHAARTLKIPVFIQRRPTLAAADRDFDHIQPLIAAIQKHQSP